MFPTFYEQKCLQNFELFFVFMFNWQVNFMKNFSIIDHSLLLVKKNLWAKKITEKTEKS